MVLLLADEISEIEFSKYEPAAYRSEPTTVVKKKSALSAIVSALRADLEESDEYMEDPELPRYYVVARTHRGDSCELKVLHNFVVSPDGFFYSRSNLPWQTLEMLYSKRPLLSRMRNRKGTRIEFEEDPCWE